MTGPRRTAPRPFAALRYILLLLAGMYAFAISYGRFAGIEPLDQFAVMRALAGSWIVAFALYGLARFIIVDPDARALWLGIVLLALGAYALVLTALAELGMAVLAPRPSLAISYVVLTVAAASVVVRPWQQKRRDLVPIVLLSAMLVGVNGYQVVARFLGNHSGRWRSAADAIVSTAARSPRGGPSAARDIYYIVLDGFGRADTLQNDYNLDLHDFVEFLRARGFYVADQARSNYAQTLLSFSSFLNLSYLDSLGSAMGKDNDSWLPLADLIQRNGLMRIAKEAGYLVTAVGADYGPTKRFAEADVCVCEQRGLDMFEQSVIGQTPFIALPLDPWTYGAHRRKVLDTFTALEQMPAASSPRFVLVHVLAPHPPFTFAADGTFRRPDRIFMFNEGSDFQGSHDEYVRGYRDQAEFIAARVRAVVDVILSRPGPRPVIVLHGDHGPGSMLQQDNPAQSNMPERMNILAAYYFPEGQERLYASMTPVNGARALANQFLGTDLPSLPDLSWFSTSEHPYGFTAVPPEAKPVK